MSAEYLTRKLAVEWLQKKGLKHITQSVMANLAYAGQGPAYARVGRSTYYRPEDLQAWLDSLPRQQGPTKRAKKAA